MGYPKYREGGAIHHKEYQPEELLEMFKGTYSSYSITHVNDEVYALVLDK